MAENVKTFPNKLVKLAKHLLGSWWGILFHTTWFIIWLVYDFNISVLALAASLESIFIGIFLLMWSNEEEALRDKKEAAAQKRNSDIIQKIYDLEHKIERQQQQILKLLTEKNLK